MCCAVELQTLFLQEKAVPAPIRGIRLGVLRLLSDPSLPALTLAWSLRRWPHCSWGHWSSGHHSDPSAGPSAPPATGSGPPQAREGSHPWSQGLWGRAWHPQPPCSSPTNLADCSQLLWALVELPGLVTWSVGLRLCLGPCGRSRAGCRPTWTPACCRSHRPHPAHLQTPKTPSPEAQCCHLLSPAGSWEEGLWTRHTSVWVLARPLTSCGALNKLIEFSFLSSFLFFIFIGA